MSSGGHSSDTDWSDDRGDYENVERNGESPDDGRAGNNREEQGDNGGEVGSLTVGPDKSRDVDEGDNTEDVDGDTSSSKSEGADVSDTEPGGNVQSDNEGEGANYENVFPAGGNANGDGTGNRSNNSETGPASDTQESVTYITGFTSEQPTMEDPGEMPNGGTDEGEPSPDSDQVGGSDAGTENEVQSDGNHYVDKSNIEPTIVSVEPPAAPPAPPPTEHVVEMSASTSIQVQSVNNRDDIGSSSGVDPYISGDKKSAVYTAPPSVGDTTGKNVILIPVTNNDERSPIDAMPTSGISNGDPRDGFSAYYSKTPAALAPTERGFVVVVPVGSTPMSTARDVTSDRPNVPTSVSTSGVVTPDNDYGRTLVYQSDASSHIMSNDTGTIIKIGGGKGVTANGDLVSAPPKSVLQNGGTVLAVGMPETQHSTSNGDATIVTLDVNHQAGKSQNGSTVFTPGLHAETHSPTTSQATYTKGQSYANGRDLINSKRHQRPPTVSPQQAVAPQWSGSGPTSQKKYEQSAKRPWVILALVVCLGIVLGVGIYFILQKANVLD